MLRPHGDRGGALSATSFKSSLRRLVPIADTEHPESRDRSRGDSKL
jgi:hypothetical protein